MADRNALLNVRPLDPMRREAARCDDYHQMLEIDPRAVLALLDERDALREEADDWKAGADGLAQQIAAITADNARLAALLRQAEEALAAAQEALSQTQEFLEPLMDVNWEGDGPNKAMALSTECGDAYHDAGAALAAIRERHLSGEEAEAVDAALLASVKIKEPGDGE